MNTRAVILARGLGTRMRTADPAAVLSPDQQRAADAGHKAMMPIAGRPFLDYVLSSAADAGFTRIALVVAPDHQALREYYEDAAPPRRLTIDFVVQHEPHGTADAVLAAERWTEGAPFATMNADNLYPPAALDAMHTLGEPGLAGFDAADLIDAGNISAGRVRAFALIEQDDRDAGGYLTRIIEKPSPDDVERLGPAARVSMNCWRFDARIFEACRLVTPSPRGELELPAAVGIAISRGVRFRVVPLGGAVLDLSQRADAPDVARRLAGTVPRP